MNNPVVAYFGEQAVKQAIGAYLKKRGVNEKNRDYLIALAPAEFLEVVCAFIEKDV
jgi:hypothetical protein